MSLYSSLFKLVLDTPIDITHPLFTYFTPKYVIDMNHRNPSIKISLVNKYSEVEVMSFSKMYGGEANFYCGFCNEKDCEHFRIVVSYLFTLPSFKEEIIKLDEYFANYEKNIQQKEFDQLIQKQLKEMSEEDLVNKIHIEPHFIDVRNSYAIEAYIGINKQYKITNLSKFLSRFDNKESFKYGKDLIITHNISHFDEPSQIFIKVLQNNKFNYFVLSPQEIDEICNAYINESIYIDNEPYKVSEDIIPCKIHIDNEYHLEIESNGLDLSSFGKKYFINKDNNSVLRYEYDENIANLIKTIKEYPLAYIKNSILDFKYTYLARYPNIFVLDEQIQKEINNDQFVIKTYLDYEDGKILLDCKLYFDKVEVTFDELYSFSAIKMFKAYQNLLVRYGFFNNIMEDPLCVFNFLNSTLEDLKNISEVYISENLANKKVSVFSSPTFSIKKEGSLLSVLLDNSIYSEEELKEIFLAIKKKKKFILIKDNFIDLSLKESKEFYETVNSFELFSNKKISKEKQLPLYYAFKRYGLSFDKLEIDDYIDKAFNEVKGFATNDINIPSINGKLRTYQKEGVKWLYALYKNELGGILADDMGLGKTIETIAFIKLINVNKPHIIVCPKSLIFNWISEFKRFYPEMKTYAINGTVSQRKQIISNIKENKPAIYFISYDSLRNEINNLKDIHFDLCILDEAQFIKNAFAKKTDAVKNISSDHHFALTGTPIENNIYDMWSIFDFLMPGYLGQLNDFQSQYENDEEYKHELKTIITPFVLRRRKEDVLKDLPDKYEILYTVEMTSQQRKIYDAHILNAREAMKDATKKDTIKIFSLLTRLRQLCVDPSLFVDKYSGGSGKINALKEIVIEKINDGHRILIFSQFVSALEIIKQEFDALNIRYEMITGDTGAKERLGICNDFNNNNEIKVVLISLKAGGTGLNLIGADTVIHLDPWWNLAAQNQASDRAHRIGQTRAVEVIKLIAENSIEQRVIELQNEKKELVEMMIAENDESIRNLSIEDLKSLLSNNL